METIILASTSPRRKHILEHIGIPFCAVSPPFEEILPGSITVKKAAEYFAVQKALKTAALNTDMQGFKRTRLIAAADTLIVFRGNIYGKPKNKEEAFFFLKAFSGKTHSVYSGIAVHDRTTGKTLSRTCISRVSFAKLGETDIQRYLALGEWKDAAGAYKIQGFAQCFIRRINGSYSSVMGLPIFEFYEILKAQNYRFDGEFSP